MADQTEAQTRETAQEYMGEFAGFTVILGLLVTLAYMATPILVATAVLPLWLGTLLMTLLTYMAYTVLHEAAHGNISGSHRSLRRVNELMGYLAAWVMMIPMTAHRHEHLAHHRNTNQPDGDPDFVVANLLRSPFYPLVAIYRILLSQFRYYFAHRWGKGPRSQDLYFCLEIAAALIPRIFFLAQGFWLEGFFLFGVATLAGFIVTMFLFAYLVHNPHEAVGRYVDTSTILVPGPLGSIVTALWGFQNYHAIHHLFPRVPFYRYPALFGRIRGAMVANGAPIYRLGLRGLRVQPPSEACPPVSTGSLLSAAR